MRLYVVLPLILTGIFGCASIKPTYEGGQANILNNDTQYKLAAIEFGELGSYGDPYKGELKNTIQLLKNTERPLLVVESILPGLARLSKFHTSSI
jgi:hypothetical protein